MPILVEDSSITDLAPPARRAGAQRCLEIGLVNNLPVASRSAGERQFRRLLEAAAGSLPVRLRRFTMIDDPDAPRTGHEPLETLRRDGIDALLVTGAEPSTEDLRDEPFWPVLADLLDWTRREAVPTLLSCLASHAAVLQAEGLHRRRLPEKRFGLFRHEIDTRHPLLRGVEGAFALPHSRWNELDPVALGEAGYRALTVSPEAGVDLFVDERHGRRLFFQGHPEYEPETLLLEWRRDVRRFLTGVQPDWPGLPRHYFGAATETRLEAFRIFALAEHRQGRMPDLPRLTAPAAAPWHVPTSRIIGNWLGSIAENRS